MKFPALPVVLAGLTALPAAANPPRLGNGLQVLCLPASRSPLFRATLHVQWDPALPDLQRQALGDLFTHLARLAGAGPWEREPFQLLLAEQGMTLACRTSECGITWTISAPEGEQEAALALLAHQVLRPRWGGSLFEGARIQAYERFRAEQPALQALRAFRAALGIPDELLPEPLLAQLSPTRAEAWHRTHIVPTRAALVLQGVADESRARELAHLHLGTWGATPHGTAPRLEVAPGSRAILAPDAAGPPRLRLGSPGPGPDLADATTRALALRVLQRRLAGAITWAGWTLQAPTEPLAGGPFVLEAPPGDSAASQVPRVLQALESLGAEPLGSAELDRARALWRNEWVALLLHPCEQAELLARLTVRNLGPKDLEGAVAAADPARVQAHLAASLAPVRLRLLCLGAGSEAAPTLEACGFGKPQIFKE